MEAILLVLVEQVVPQGSIAEEVPDITLDTAVLLPEYLARKQAYLKNYRRRSKELRLL
jgi:hypothetical protein